MKIELGKVNFKDMENKEIEGIIVLKFKGKKLTAIDYTDLCLECKKSTQFGSGLKVNRVPAGWNSSSGDDCRFVKNRVQNEYETEGYVCAECGFYECDRCSDKIHTDEDVDVIDKNGEEWRVHEECTNFDDGDKYADNELEYDRLKEIERKKDA